MATMTTQDKALESILEILRAHLPELSERYGVKTLGVFGSYVRGEQRKRSDLDILVEFDPCPSLLTLSALQRRLCAITGLKVDVVVKRSLKPAIGRAILSEVIYV